MTVQPESSGKPIEVRRNAGLLLLVAFGSLAMAAAYGWRASQTSATVLWVVVGALVVIGVLHLVAWMDARTPVLVADDHGVRLRDGREWHGLTWSAIDRVELEPRRGILRDGRIVVVPSDDDKVRTLPMGLATAARADEVVRRLTALAKNRTAVAVKVTGTQPASGSQPLAPGWVPAADHDDGDEDAHSEEAADVHDAEVPPDTHEQPAEAPRTEPEPVAESPAVPIGAVSAMGSTRPAVRAELTRDTVASYGMLALDDPAPHTRELRGTEGRVGLVIEETPVAEDTEPEPLTAVESDDDIAPDVDDAAAEVDEAEPAEETEPLLPIGRSLQEAREQLGVTIEAAAERTRIRPHVIEAIETDEFAPCGGDFYARGHLRSLARVVGADGDALVRSYDATYAQAPIQAREVFEAELATGPRPSIRLTKGAPNWAALVGVVLILAMIWGAAQYFIGDNGDGRGGAAASVGSPVEAAKNHGRDQLGKFGAPTSNKLTLTGRGNGTRVVVRTSDGSVSWRGRLAGGERKRLEVPGKATVEVERGRGVRAAVNRAKSQLIGGKGNRDKAVLGRQ